MVFWTAFFAVPGVGFVVFGKTHAFLVFPAVALVAGDHTTWLVLFCFIVAADTANLTILPLFLFFLLSCFGFGSLALALLRGRSFIDVPFFGALAFGSSARAAYLVCNLVSRVILLGVHYARRVQHTSHDDRLLDTRATGAMKRFRSWARHVDDDC